MSERLQIGLWSEPRLDACLARGGLPDVLGALVEGAARARTIKFHLCVAYGMADLVREEFRALNAEEGVDWVVDEPPHPQGCIKSAKARAIASALAIDPEAFAQAMFANSAIHVAAWIVARATDTGALLLKAPRTTLLPDVSPYDFPLEWKDGWGADGLCLRWRAKAANMLGASASVIASSRQIATRQGVALFGLPEEKIHIVAQAPRDLAALVPQSNSGRRTPESVRAAAKLLRTYGEQRRIDVLREFRFEDQGYIFAPTLGRPNPNIAAVDLDASTPSPPRKLEDEGLPLVVLSLPDQPRSVRAALHHCAVLTIDRSFALGMAGAFGFYDSVSVGTPCLTAHGPHVAELLDKEPALSDFAFDPYDRQDLARLVERTMRNRDAALSVQMAAYERSGERGWDEVASDYAAVAIGEKITSEPGTPDLRRVGGRTLV